VRATLAREVDYRANGPRIGATEVDSPETKAYREHLNSQGSPSEIVADGYRYFPGGELAAVAPSEDGPSARRQ
jgi:hypothetical protein